MTATSVRALRSIEIGLTDPVKALKFFTDVWHLAHVGDSNAVHHLRGTGPFHHILGLRFTPRPALIRMVFDAADRAAVDAHSCAGRGARHHGHRSAGAAAPAAWRLRLRLQGSGGPQHRRGLRR